MSIYRGAGGAGDAVADSSSEALLVRELAVEVQADADAAAASATAAAGSASNASSSASAASSSATAAASSASAAASSATNAANSAASIIGDVADAQAAQAAAASSASAASTSATNAANSASAASTSASNANSSASSASTQATNASNSASAAATSATNASNSASAASTSATNASNSATSASGSASTATTQASNASTSATNAATSATNASNSASTATTQAGIATTQATNSASSASAASTSASNAATSATNAASAQTAAESARDATLAAYDNFDDRYLGSKTSNPSLDNDGNALVGGALYFNSTAGEMRVYTGTAWVSAYVSGTGFLAAANNLSDVTNTTTARTNLGLAIGTNVQAYDADLATIAGLTPTNNFAIIGNGTSWTSSALPTPASTLNDLTDVTITTPATDQVLKYNGTNWVNGTGASVVVGTSPPSSPVAGAFWWDSENGKLKIYYDDGTSLQWVDTFTGTTGFDSSVLMVAGGQGFSTTSTTLVDVPNLTAPLTAGTWVFVVDLSLQSSSTAGARFCMTYTGSLSNIEYTQSGMETTNADGVTTRQTTSGSTSGTAYGSSSNDQLYARMFGTIVATGAGNLKVQIAKVTSGTATTYPSVMTYYRVA